jgi:hypothetical protein
VAIAVAFCYALSPMTHIVRIIPCVALAACASTFPNDQRHQEAAFRNVQERTSFDLGCNDAKLTRLGDVARLGQQMTRVNVGASCGDKRASYVVTCVSNWGDISCTPELNASTQSSAAQHDPPAE